MKKLLLIALLIVGCGYANVKLQNSDEIGEFKKKSFPINSDNKWSINIGLTATKGGTILGLARNYRIREKTSVFILGGLLTTGLGVIYEQNYNDNGYVIGAYSGIDLGVGYYKGWFYSASWRIAPFIAYQRVFKNQHCFSIGVSSGLLKYIYSMKPIYSNFEPNHQSGYSNATQPLSFRENKIIAFIFPILSYEYRF